MKERKSEKINHDQELRQRSKHNELPNRVVGMVGSLLCHHNRAINGVSRLETGLNPIQGADSTRTDAPDNDGV
jgi:hypothetical protein